MNRYRLVPGYKSSHKAELLTAIMKSLAENAHISFEGDLSHCRFSPELNCSDRETENLRRNTIEPLQDFVVIPLEAGTIQPILDSVLPENRFVKKIIHIQIEKNGALRFGAFDNFDPESVWCSFEVPRELLDQLRSSQAVRSYQLARD